MRRVGLTGASGFLGRPLAARLAESGWLVSPLGRDPRSEEPLDAVVHLAFPTDHALRAERPLEALASVANGTTAAIAFAARAGARHFVLASSGKVYGAPRALPIAEDHPIAPSTRLGRLKELAERLARFGADDAGLAVTALRIFNVFGPGQANTFFVPKVVEAARSGVAITLGELDHRRDWLYVDDVVRAFESALANAPAPGEFRAINVGSGRSASGREILELVERAVGAPVIHRVDARLSRPDEPFDERADASRARRLGWSPTIDLEAGILAHVRARGSARG